MSAYGDKPADLKAVLAKHNLQFVCFSSGNLLLDPAKEAETLALHEEECPLRGGRGRDPHAGDRRAAQGIGRRPPRTVNAWAAS